MPDRRTDTLARDRIGRIERRARRFQRVVLAAIVVLTFSNVVALKGNADRTSDIQRERVRSIRESCEAQNKRNALAYLFLKALPPSPAQPQRSPAETDRLLRGFTDALVGQVRDCPAVVRRVAPSAP